MQNVLLDYGLEGYGLYWYCIELIAGKVSKDNITFELEHDARILARNTGSTIQKVEEMMRYFIKHGLFESSDGVVTCLKLARRIDQSMAGNAQMRAVISGIRNNTKSDTLLPELNENHDSVMTESVLSHDSVMQEQNRTDKNRTEYTDASADACLFEQVWQAYPKRQGGNPKPAALAKYKAMIRKGYTHDQLMTAVKQYAKIIMQEKTQPQFVKQACTFFGPGGHVDDMLSIYAQEQDKKAANQQKYVTAVVVEKAMSDEARAQFKALREG